MLNSMSEHSFISAHVQLKVILGDLGFDRGGDFYFLKFERLNQTYLKMMCM